MGRGPESQQTKLAKALAEVQKAFGITLEVPMESANDLMREAQSAIFYYENSGAFNHKTCKWCSGVFAYNWDHDSIAYCSISCAAKYLESIGLRWDPSKPLEERWGKTTPAVVPPQVIELLDSDGE